MARKYTSYIRETNREYWTKMVLEIPRLSAAFSSRGSFCNEGIHEACIRVYNHNRIRVSMMKL